MREGTDVHKPDTLRLGFATPRRWLEDGKSIRVERAPTAFGSVSLKLESQLAAGKVLADVELPRRDKPAKTLLRIRVPEGWEVSSVQGPNGRLAVDPVGTIDLSGLKGRVNLVCLTRKK